MTVKLQEKDYKEDVVYLFQVVIPSFFSSDPYFQFPGTPYAPSVSPYCIKVEAFCRLHDLKFEVD